MYVLCNRILLTSLLLPSFHFVCVVVWRRYKKNVAEKDGFLKFDDGILEVTVSQAKNIRNVSMFGYMDAYAKVVLMPSNIDKTTEAVR